jgi:hypothetical protein
MYIVAAEDDARLKRTNRDSSPHMMRCGRPKARAAGGIF